MQVGRRREKIKVNKIMVYKHYDIIDIQKYS